VVLHRDKAAVSCNEAPETGEHFSHPYASQHGVTPSASARRSTVSIRGVAPPSSQSDTERRDVSARMAIPFRLSPAAARADLKRSEKVVLLTM